MRRGDRAESSVLLRRRSWLRSVNLSVPAWGGCLVSDVLLDFLSSGLLKVGRVGRRVENLAGAVANPAITPVMIHKSVPHIV